MPERIGIKRLVNELARLLVVVAGQSVDDTRADGRVLLLGSLQVSVVAELFSINKWAVNSTYTSTNLIENYDIIMTLL